MKPGLGSRAEQVTRNLVPALLALVCLGVGVLPLGVPYLAGIMPVLILIVVFYWSLYRPDLMPPLLAFLVGLLYDALSGGPPGLMAVVLLAVHGVCVSQRRVFLSKSYLVGWFGFIVVGAGALLVAWIMASLYYVAWIDPRSVLFQFLVTAALYPVFAGLFALLQIRVVKG